jgi:hypothetical protein
MALTVRDIEILDYKIGKLNTLIANLTFYGISNRKIQKSVAKRDRYQTQLDAA